MGPKLRSTTRVTKRNAKVEPDTMEVSSSDEEIGEQSPEAEHKQTKRVKRGRLGKTKEVEVSIKTKSSKNSKDGGTKASWTVEEVLAQEYQIQQKVSRNFTALIQDECTLPFIARYRREQVGNLDIEELRKMKSTLEDLQKLQTKISSVIKTLEKQNQLTDSTKQAICNSRDMEELDHWYAPFKETKKRTLAARAKELGLEDAAMKVLYTAENVSFQSLVNDKVEALENESCVTKGIQHIIADVVGKDAESITYMEDLISSKNIQLKSSKSRSASKQDQDKISKFENYMDVSFSVSSIKPHIVLALNRGEDLKILSVKVIIPDVVEQLWIKYCHEKFILSHQTGAKKKLVIDSIQDAYTRIVEPLFARKIRTNLTKIAHRASIDVFATNLKNLLLSPPLKETNVVGLDPGFKHGCKCAAVAADGSVLQTETILIRFGESAEKQPAARVLRDIIQRFRCSTIALGNGTACRETETFLSQLIKRKFFGPIDVQYTIVSESGASIYSCAPEAKAEFPNLDPNVISAISIARRLQDPLTEYVRVSPQHLGIGMYQHDVPVKRLESSLDEIVCECVSFVGVDLNTCPLHVLSKVAGLSENKAKKIIEYRQENGPFACRQQLMDVKMIGAKTFEQCAGFLRILNASGSASEAEPLKKIRRKASGKRTPTNEPNPLDRTCVHPESYHIADKIIEMAAADPGQIGYPSFIEKIVRFLRGSSVEKLSLVLEESLCKVEQIVNSLQQPLRYDLREKFDKPLFKRGITSMSDLKIGTVLTGQVANVTHFGAFVDIGVGKTGLLHVSQMKGRNDQIQIGNRVTVSVKNLDVARERINLEFISF